LDFVNGAITVDPFIAGYPNYPPSALVFLWPLAILPWDVFRIVWAILNACFAIGIVYLLWRLYFKTTGWHVLIVVIALFLLGTPTRNTIGIGQNGLFSLFFFLLALSAVRGGHRVSSAWALAISWLKYTLTFPLSIVFLTKSRLGITAGAALIHAGLTLALSVWTRSNPLELQLGPIRAYFHQIDPLGRFRSPVGEVDLFALADRLGLTELATWTALPAAIFIVICAAAIVLRRQHEDELLNLSLLSLVSTVCFIHSAGYDLILLVFPLSYLARSFAADSKGVKTQPLHIAFVVAITLSCYVLRAVEMMQNAVGGPTMGIIRNVASVATGLSIFAALAICIWHTGSTSSATITARKTNMTNSAGKL
jgi:hypothetical protein